MLSAWAWRLLMDHVDPMDLMDKMGAPRYTRGFAVPLWSLAQCADLPLGKKNPAARLEESAAIPTGKSVRDF